MQKTRTCPHCGQALSLYANPYPTADVIIYEPALGIVIIKRANPPVGYAFPGGFIEEGEFAEEAARREMLEETGLDVTLKGLLGLYSDPSRDPRFHTLTAVYVGTPKDVGALKAGDDAAGAAFYPLDALPQPLVFDHARIIQDFCEYLEGKRPLVPLERSYRMREGL
ncbi:MAG: NUDIX hydrolase [Desulfovibrionaceae bacterium]|nr:NUDIX hydrolase [Desulfovibrionaceae bacterium]